MVEYIVNKIVKEYDISYQEAYSFYYKVLDKRKLGILLDKIDDFIDFKEMKEYFLGGN